jgi:neutral ceramidase
MRFRHFITFVLSVLAVPFGLLAQDSTLAKTKLFRAGAATSNITPAIGGLIVGGFHPAPSTHVHDELHARCLVLDNGETRMAFVVCDLLGLAQEVCDAARSLIHAENSIPEENILICATHTHSAATAMGTNRFAFGVPLDDYQKFLVRRIADGVRRAVRNLAPAKIGWAIGQDPNQVFNRRWFMKPGSIGPNPFGGTNDHVRMNPPRESPDMVKPAGPTDPEICLIALETPNGKPLALLANYALHYVGGVNDGDISADYFAVFCDRMQQLLGADRQDPPFVAMLSNGTSGDINNIDFTKPEGSARPYEKMREVADDVAQAALKAYKTIQFHDWVPLGGQLQFVEMGIRHPSPELLERSKKIVEKAGNPPVLKTTEQIYAERTLRMNEYPATLPMPVQALRIGDVGIAGMPNEVFCEIGLELKRRSPFKPSFTMEIANGYYGYLPSPAQHKLGGYETWLATNRLETEASTKYVEAILAMWKELKIEP